MTFRFGLALFTFFASSCIPVQSHPQSSKESNRDLRQSKPNAANDTDKKEGWIVDKKTEAKGGVPYLRTACPANCKDIGDKAVFVTKDGKVWEIANQESLKGHEGRFVELHGSFDPQNKTLHVGGLTNLACGSRFCERKCKGKCGNGTSCDCER
jgi:hypothetical protein